MATTTANRSPLIVQPHLYMGDVTGRPLDYGMVYFGEPNKDPEFYPIDIFYDEALTIPATQPVRTKGGFLNANGDICEIFAKELTYSVKVLDQYKRKVFYKRDMSRTNTDKNITSILPFPNAVPRPLAEKNADSVSVKDFGAKGDGIKDDTIALRNAFTMSNRQNVKIPAGTYLVSSMITLADNPKHLEFDAGAIIKRNFDGAAVILVTGNDWKISGGEFDGNKSIFKNFANAGIFITGNKNTVDNCKVHDNASHGISIDGAGGGGTDNTVNSCIVKDCDAVGISQYKAVSSSITNNRVYNAGAEGITVDLTNRSRVIGNVIDGAARIGAVGGMGVDAAFENTIAGNLIVGTKNKLPAITLESQAGNTHHNTVMGNNLLDNEGHGIWIRHRDIIFNASNNSFYATPPANTYGQGDWNAITGNNIRGVPSGFYPIRVDKNCVGNVLSGNVYDGKLPSIDPASIDTRSDAGLAAFMAKNTVWQSNITGDNSEHQVKFDNIVFDRGMCYDNSSGVFTVPVNGVYQFSASVRTVGGSNHDYQILSIVTSNGTFSNGVSATDQSAQMTNTSAVVYMSSGDTAKVIVRVGGGAKVISVEADPNHTWFNGSLIG